MRNKLNALQSRDEHVRHLIESCTNPAELIRRQILLTDWKARSYAPAWLELIGLERQAARLRLLPEITGPTETSILSSTLNAVLADMEADSHDVLSAFPPASKTMRLKRLDKAASLLTNFFLAGVLPGYSRLAWDDPAMVKIVRGGLLRYVRGTYMGAGVLLALRVMQQLPEGMCVEEINDAVFLQLLPITEVWPTMDRLIQRMRESPNGWPIEQWEAGQHEHQLH